MPLGALLSFLPVWLVSVVLAKPNYEEWKDMLGVPMILACRSKLHRRGLRNLGVTANFVILWVASQTA